MLNNTCIYVLFPYVNCVVTTSTHSDRSFSCSMFFVTYVEHIYSIIISCQARESKLTRPDVGVKHTFLCFTCINNVTFVILDIRHQNLCAPFIVSNSHLNTYSCVNCVKTQYIFLDNNVTFFVSDILYQNYDKREKHS